VGRGGKGTLFTGGGEKQKKGFVEGDAQGNIVLKKKKKTKLSKVLTGKAEGGKAKKGGLSPRNAIRGEIKKGMRLGQSVQ